MSRNIVTILALFATFMLVLPATHDAFARLAGDEGPFVTYIGLEMQSGTNNFKVFFKVHAGANSIENVKVLVTSDIETAETTFDFISANNYELLRLDISAFSPYSIRAEIMDYQIHKG